MCIRDRYRTIKQSGFNVLSRYKIGDAFISLPVSAIQEMLSESSGKIDELVADLEENLSSTREEMEQLKTSLYARFGKSINLET